MNYQKLIVVGNVTRDAERKTSRKGDVAYTTFGVGVSDRKGQSVFFPVTLFGQAGETLTQYITKGRQVAVEGRITVNDNGYFNVIADRIELGAMPRSISESEQDEVEGRVASGDFDVGEPESEIEAES